MERLYCIYQLLQKDYCNDNKMIDFEIIDKNSFTA